MCEYFLGVDRRFSAGKLSVSWITVKVKSLLARFDENYFIDHSILGFVFFVARASVGSGLVSQLSSKPTVDLSSPG